MEPRKVDKENGATGDVNEEVALEDKDVVTDIAPKVTRTNPRK